MITAGIHPTLPCLSRLRWCVTDRLPNLGASIGLSHPHYLAAAAEHSAVIKRHTTSVAEAAYWEFSTYGAVYGDALDIEEIKAAVWTVYPEMKFITSRDGRSLSI